MAIWRVHDRIDIRNPNPIRGDSEIASREGRTTRVYLKVERPRFRGVSVNGEPILSLDIPHTYRVEEMAGDKSCLEASRIHSFPVLPGLSYQSAKIIATAYEKTWIVNGQHFEQMILPRIPGTLVQDGLYRIDTARSDDHVLVGALVNLFFEIEYDPTLL